MQSSQNSPLSPASQFHQNPAFWAQIPSVYAVPPLYPSLGSSSITHLLNKSPPSLVGPSTRAFVRSLTCPPDAQPMLYDLCRPQKNMLLRHRQLPKISKPYAIPSQATLAIGILLSTLRQTNVARLLVSKSWLSLLLVMKR